MCDLSGKLVAWLDQELPEAEALDVHHHLSACPECRIRLEEYKKVTVALAAYSERLAGERESHLVPRWAPLIAAAVVMAVLLLAFSRAPIASPPRLTPAIAAAPTVVAAARALPIRKTGRPHALLPKRKQAANLSVRLSPEEPSIEIAIPAEAMFPPGALPEGLSFIAELRISADGAAQQLRLRP